MQFLRAGEQQLIFLELERDMVSGLVKQAGFAAKINDSGRGWILELLAEGREGPLLLFDAADPANLGWFSRCQFYVDGNTGAVLQSPFILANTGDREGRPVANAIRLQINKELPLGFRLPGRQQVTDQLVYAVLASFLLALTQNGVAICGGSVVKPLAGRTESLAGRT